MTNTNRGARIPMQRGRDERAQPGDPEAESRVTDGGVGETGGRGSGAG